MKIDPFRKRLMLLRPYVNTPVGSNFELIDAWIIIDAINRKVTRYVIKFY